MNGYTMNNQVPTRIIDLNSLSKKNLCRLYARQLEAYRREAEKLDAITNVLQIKILRGEKKHADRILECCRP